MTSIDADKKALENQNLIGKIFEHHGSKRKCKIESIEKKLKSGSKAEYEVIVTARPIEKAAHANHIEELQYFLGTFRQIS